MEAETLDDEFDSQGLAGIANQKGRRKQSASMAINDNEEDLTDTLKA